LLRSVLQKPQRHAANRQDEIRFLLELSLLTSFHSGKGV